MTLDARLAVAPMMARTDRHERYFLRLISKRTLLYTEMLTTGAVLHGDTQRLLRFDPSEHPVALQLGGCEPAMLARAAELGAMRGYDEINLNVGCPSPRVQSARFGACLMAEPLLVARCIDAMIRAVDVAVTVKTRIGIDDRDDYEHLREFVERVAEAGCRRFIIHARKAWLAGLSPKQNRQLPPLRHDWVHALKRDLPHLHIVLNGGIRTLPEALEHLAICDGVMLGREAYANPYLLAGADASIFGMRTAPRTRHDVIRAYLPYAAVQLHEGVALRSLTRHILGLFHGRPGASEWRRLLSTPHPNDVQRGTEAIEQALSRVPEAAEDGEIAFAKPSVSRPDRHAHRATEGA
jgi:tRNA-dihydrouridine synthase A